MNKEKWQAELKQLQLTENQKLKMIQHVKSPEKKKANWTYRLAVPTFAVVCALFLFLVMDSESLVPTLNHGAEQDVTTDHREYIMETLIYLAIAFSLYVVNCILAFWIVKKTIRWQETIAHYREKWSNYTWLFVSFMSAIIIAGAWSLWFICSTLIGSKIIIFVLILMLLLLLQLYIARNVRRPLPCPVCDHTYSTREIRKIVLSFKIEQKCSKCENSIFHTKETKFRLGLTTFFMGPPIPLTNMIGLPLIVIMCIFIPYFLIVWRYILPSYIELQDTDSFMW